MQRNSHRSIISCIVDRPVKMSEFPQTKLVAYIGINSFSVKAQTTLVGITGKPSPPNLIGIWIIDIGST